MHQVIGEVDHHADTGEQQHDRTTDRQPRIRLSPDAGPEANGEQASGAVDECGDEHAQYDLGGPVPEKVSQQARRELGRRQLQGDDREAEHERDDGDHGAGHGDQQVPRVVGSSLEGQAAQEAPWSDVDAGDHGSPPPRRARQPPSAAPRARRWRIPSTIHGAPPDGLGGRCLADAWTAIRCSWWKSGYCAVSARGERYPWPPSRSWGVAHALDGLSAQLMRGGPRQVQGPVDSQWSMGLGRSRTMCGMSSPWLAQASRSGVDMASMVAAWSRSK